MPAAGYAALFFALCCCQAIAGECRIEKQATLPVTFSGHMPTVPVSINGHVLPIGVDTGAQRTLITPETVGLLRLPQDRHHFTKIIGTSGSYRVDNILIRSFNFAGTDHPDYSTGVITFRFPATGNLIPANTRITLAGVIGADILSGYDIEYDTTARTMTLYRVHGCTKMQVPWDGAAITIPLAVTPSNRISIPVILNGHSLRGIFDTGASRITVAQSAAFKAGVTVIATAHDIAAMSAGVGGAQHKAHIHLFDSLIIAFERFRNVHILIADYPPYEADMLIGEDYMAQRRFWISYATKTLFIQPHPKG
jgi:predicted aspartyl protease